MYLTQRRMSPEQTIKTELTVWKWAAKRVKSKPTPEHNATEQADGPKWRQKLKQQGQHALYQGHFIFNLRIPQEFRFMQFVYHCQKYSKQNM